MDREIKFRLWDKAEQIFVPDDRFAVINGRQRGDQLAICITPWLAVQVDEIWYSHQGELMQYTGLKDKNGTEIYEADLVSVDLYEYAGINETNEHVIGDNSGNTNFFTDVAYLNGIKSEHIEVIGNIYENTELIEQ